MTLSSGLRVEALADLSTALDLASAGAALRYRKGFAWTDGSGLGQANQVFHDTRELAASASEELDLAGVLTNAVGATATFARVKALLVYAAKTNANNVVVGGAASNAFASMFGAATHTQIVKPGGLWLVAADDAVGYPVTAATGDLLKIANSGAGSVVKYDVVIIGASA